MTPLNKLRPPPRPARRRSLLALAGLALPVGAASASGGRAQSGASANLAMIGEPQTLDPMASTSDLVGTIMQHVFETLYTFDARWRVVPMLAAGMPIQSGDGRHLTIPLRQGVRFHDGTEMVAADVIASLRRWMRLAPRGKTVAGEIVSLHAPNRYTVELVLRGSYAPLLAQLALPAGFAAIMPAATGDGPLQRFVGTGPYRFIERRADQYVLLRRFDKYSARAEPADGYAGRRQALLAELRFIPVPNPNTRIEGAMSGQFHYADQLPVEKLLRFDGQPQVRPVVTAPFGFPYAVLNTGAGILADQAVRQGVQAALNMNDIMAAAFGDRRFYTVEASHYPPGSPFHSDARASDYNQNNPGKARRLASQSGYRGGAVRLLVSKQYEFHYRIAMVIGSQLRKAGFLVDLQVVDWATLVQRRNQGALWDIYITHSVLLPEPVLAPPQLGSGAPGGWDSAAKRAAMERLNRLADGARRASEWGRVQALVYTEVPYIKLGSFNSLAACAASLRGYVAMPWPFFWNTGVAA